MPELPDVTVYCEALSARVVGHRLRRAVVTSPFLVRTYDPPLALVEGCGVRSIELLGKRLVFELEAPPGEPHALFLVIHLMIAGRLHWRAEQPKTRRRSSLATFEFDSGVLILSEASQKKRASLHLVRGREPLARLDPGGVDVFRIGLEEFRARVRSGNHTLKRILTDPRRFSGIGNAYSDEILHRARLSPILLSQRIDDREIERLFDAVRDTLSAWIEKLRAEADGDFPEKVTAFRPDMAVHGRFRKPCPDCGAPVQRIVYRDNETNYCATCQTNGKLLADRALSRLLRGDWPKTLEEWEQGPSR